MPLSQDDQVKYKALYLQTARQYIDELQKNLHQLIQGTEIDKVIDTLHRDAHSLKGQSLMMEYKSMGTISLLMEKIFEAKKENKSELPEDILVKLDEASREMSDCLNIIAQTSKEKNLSQAIESLKAYANITI
ncbi:MAG TPA: Hpt domain-containing protein [Candidatus Sulfotelmatobacter sp.]|jgi:chemotaxis protein histidine kinase CheA|nr:Hpt domain-containing protein [Candidatus Sulfotelmatobacter sp.]